MLCCKYIDDIFSGWLYDLEVVFVCVVIGED